MSTPMDKPAQRVSDEQLVSRLAYADSAIKEGRCCVWDARVCRSIILDSLADRATIAAQAEQIAAKDAEIERLKDEMTEATEKIRDDLDERFAAVEAQLKTVLDREAATIKRHDEQVERLTAALTNLICRINRDGGQAMTGNILADAAAADLVAAKTNADKDTAEAQLKAAREAATAFVKAWDENYKYVRSCEQVAAMHGAAYGGRSLMPEIDALRALAAKENADG